VQLPRLGGFSAFTVRVALNLPGWYWGGFYTCCFGDYLFRRYYGGLFSLSDGDRKLLLADTERGLCDLYDRGIWPVTRTLLKNGGRRVWPILCIDVELCLLFLCVRNDKKRTTR